MGEVTDRFPGLSESRYRELSLDDEAMLTHQEWCAGWHFCREWDEMLIHESWPESDCCMCGERD